MSTYAFLLLCFQACLVQRVYSQCGNSYYGGVPLGNYPAGVGPTGPLVGASAIALAPAVAGAAPATLSSTYGGVGDGEVAVAGELPVTGATLVTGQVPVLGAVQFSGSVPASGAVTITGSCSCGCGGKIY